MITFSNPRLKAEFNDWPSGSHRVKCVFEVIHKPGKGWKFNRTTWNPKTGLPNKPKADIAFGRQACIVDGDDGRTYLIQRTASFNAISVYSSDFYSAQIDGNNSYFSVGHPLYAVLSDLIDQANSDIVRIG